MYAGLGVINAKLQTFSHVNTAGPWEAVLNQFAKWAWLMGVAVTFMLNKNSLAVT